MLEPKLEPEIAVHINRLRYVQEGDCCNDELQSLDVSIESGGGGHFIAIRTKRWALSPDSLRQLADDLARYVEAADKAWGEHQTADRKENDSDEPGPSWAAAGERVPLRKAEPGGTGGF